MWRIFLWCVVVWTTIGWTTGISEARLPVIETRFDRIPDLTSSATIRSQQDGAWSDPNTWFPSRVPQETDRVVIHHRVTYATTQGIAETITVHQQGALIFSNTQTTLLRVVTWMVMDGGRVEIGTVDHPLPPDVFATIIFRDQPLNIDDDPEQYLHGLLVVDGTMMIHGSEKTPFIRLAEPIDQPHTTRLQLEAVPIGWQEGDEIFIPDSRDSKIENLSTREDVRWEYRRIAHINGTTITLDAPLSYRHPGAYDREGQLRFLPHVANLSRNITFQSEQGEGVRGHTLVTGTSAILWKYASFVMLGRTTIDPLDNTILDIDGDVTHVGLNQIARYPIHAHHLLGPPTFVESTCQFVFAGLVVDGGRTVHHKWKWGVTLHDSSFGCVYDNVVHNISGTGIGSEDGNEQNLIHHNFVSVITGTGKRADAGCGEDCGREGVGIWSRGPLNTITNNVVTNSPSRSCYTFFLKNRGMIRVARQPGVDPFDPGASDVVSIQTLPIKKFSHNECYGLSNYGLVYWWVGVSQRARPAEGVERSYMTNLVTWHVRQVVFTYAGYVTLSHVIGLADPALVGEKHIAIEFRDYVQWHVILEHVELQGYQWGIILPVMQHIKGKYDLTEPGEFILRDSMVSCYHGLIGRIPFHNNSPFGFHPVVNKIQNVRFLPYPWKDPLPREKSFYGMKFEWPPRRNSDVTVSQKFLFEEYQGIHGNNFQAFYLQQHPDAIMLDHAFTESGRQIRIGAPKPGLTNREAWEKYGVATAGELAPCEDRLVEEIEGFTCRITSPPDQALRPLSPQHLSLF